MTRSRNRALRTTLISVAVALSVSLSGCVSPFPFPTSNQPIKPSTPTGDEVSPELQPFYSQVVKWTKCEGTFQCATVKAPMDWNDPARSKIELALIRAQAPGNPKGSLLVNPGGPGGSGYDFVRDSLDYAVGAKLIAQYDIVGFDPRGVNKSSAVKCYDANEMDSYLFDIQPDAGVPGSDSWLNMMDQQSEDFGKACLKNTGELLGFVDTVSAARDLDLLRAVLGDKKLNYLGYSYGTFLGATYASLYPEKTGHLVLDGALDPATTDFDVTKTQAVGFEKALRAYIADCLTGSTCPFKGTVDESMAKVSKFLGQLEASPLRASDGRFLGSAVMFYAIILPLYNKDNWPILNDVFSDSFSGDPDYAFTIADYYFGRNPNGTYNDNSFEAFVAINCLDYMSTSTRGTLEAEAKELAAAAPVFGPQMSWGGTSCDKWPFQSTRVREPIAAQGSAPILVVGTTGDPATPYQWAKNLASQLENGHLITYDGEGHTAYNGDSACVNNAVEDFFLKDIVPAKDPRC
ncbi:MAG: alpha/beta hydrolase [Terrimesophilobacter sp.]